MKRIISFLLLSTLVFATYYADYSLSLQQGLEHQRSGNYAQAIKAYKEVISEKPHIYEVYPRIAVCFEKLGYSKIAKKYYTKTLDYDPQNEIALKALKRFKSIELAEQNKTVEPVLIEMSDGSNTITKGSNSSIADLGRLWVLRDGHIFTIRRDGSDLSAFSEVSFYQVGQFQAGDKGIPVVYQQKDFQPDIFFMYPEDASMIRLSRCPVACQDPVYFTKTNSVVYIQATSSTSNEIYEVEVVEFEDQLSPKRILAEFEWVGDLKLHGDLLFFSGRKPDQRKKIYSLHLASKELKQESFGLGDDRRPLPSPNGKFLAVQRQTQKDQWNWQLFERGTNYNYQLTFFDGTDIQGTWGTAEEYFYFTSSKPGVDDRWNSILGRVLVREKFVEEIQKSNFLYQDLQLGAEGVYLFYLTNYDNNYEVYRLALVKDGLPERLTISQADEMQYGFWTFSNY